MSEIIQENEQWYWQDFGDESGSLCMPNGKAFASYDLNTGEIWFKDYSKSDINPTRLDFQFIERENLQLSKSTILQKMPDAMDKYLSDEMKQQYMNSFNKHTLQSVYQPEVDYEYFGDQIIFNKLKLANERGMLKKEDIISRVNDTSIAIEVAYDPDLIYGNIELKDGMYYEYRDYALPDRPLSEILDDNTKLLNEETIRYYIFSFNASDITAIWYDGKMIEVQEGTKQMSAYDKACISAEAHQIVHAFGENIINEYWEEYLQSCKAPDADRDKEINNVKEWSKQLENFKGSNRNIYEAAIEEAIELAEMGEPDFEMEM